MSNHTKLWLTSAAVVVAGLAAAPVFATVAPETRPVAVANPSIRVEGPKSADTLGTIWFEIGGTGATTSYGGPR